MSILSQIAAKVKSEIAAESTARANALTAEDGNHKGVIADYESNFEGYKSDFSDEKSNKQDEFDGEANAYEAEVEASLDNLKSNTDSEDGINSLTEAVADMDAKGAAIQASIDENTKQAAGDLDDHVSNMGDYDDFVSGFSTGHDGGGAA